MNCVADIRQAFGSIYKSELFIKDKLGGSVIEIINASFVADQPTIFGTLNQDYVDREHEWYCSMSRNVKSFPGGAPTIWKEVADQDGYINSNYGWCCFSQTNGFQFTNVIKELAQNPDSRRAVMIYTRPSMWKDYNENGRSDFICTNTVQYVIRYGLVCAIVQMRSQDAVYGYKNDRAWQAFMLNRVVKSLKDSGMDVMAGPIYWNVGSLHVYDRHYYLVDHFNKTGVWDVKKGEYNDEERK